MRQNKNLYEDIKAHILRLKPTVIFLINQLFMVRLNFAYSLFLMLMKSTINFPFCVKYAV